MIPAGWYRDPNGAPGTLRWWDGAQWTQATQSESDLAGAPQTAGAGIPAGAAQTGGAPAGDAPADAVRAGDAQSDEVPGGGAAGTGPAGGGTSTGGVPAGGTASWETQTWGAQGWAAPGQQAPGWGAPGQGAPGWGPQQPSWGWDGVPQAWTQPAPASAGRRNRALLIGGGASAAVVVIVVLVVLVATGTFGGGGGTSGGTSGTSPVAATITDAGAGLTYARLGGAWQPDTVSPTGNLGKLGFDQGETAVVQENFEDGHPYVASAYSGVASGATSGSLEATAKGIISALEPVAYPAHTRQDLTSAAHPVGGHDGWLAKVKFTFPQAKANGWNFRTETAAVVVVDRGAGLPPAEFYVSIPDSHKKQGDLDLLLSSLKVS